MEINIGELLDKLEKGGLSGQELGILEVENASILFRQGKEGKPAQPIFSMKRFTEAVRGIKDAQDSAIYNGYIAIHDWIRINHNAASTHIQQAQVRWKVISSLLAFAVMEENFLGYLAQLPAIMTQKQYEEAHKRGDITAPGVAILQADSNLIDGNGDYKQPDTSPLCTALSRFFDGDPEQQENITAAKDHIDALVESLYFLKNYNLLLDMVADFYGLPDITVFQTDTPFFERQVKELNASVTDLAKQIKDSRQPDEMKQKKLQVLTDHFPAIKYDAIKPPKKCINDVKKLFPDFSAFRHNNINSILLYRRGTYEA